MKIGVLALQGGFAAHGRALEALGHQVVEVRYPEHLEGLDGMVFPGGESTTQLKLIAAAGLAEPLDDFVRAGHPTLATCAGVILSAKQVRDPAQESMSWLDVDVSRNAWGRQVFSFEARSEQEQRGLEDLPLVFIRAPRFTRIGEGVETCIRYKGEPVLLKQGPLFAATFHPELTDDLRVHHLVFGGELPEPS